MTDLKRRALLRGGAITAMAVGSTSSSSVVSAASPEARIATMISTSDRVALAALRDVKPGQIVHLGEGQRAGLFTCVAGDPPATPDPLQGLFISSTTAHVHFARLWDGTHGRPEWFGAVTGDGNADCAPAIEACYALCPVTQLGQADYYIQRTVRFSLSHRTVRGEGNWASDNKEGTRIILARGSPGLNTADIMAVGSVDKPNGGGESYPTENHFSNFTLVRDGPCTPHASGDLARYATGLRASYLYHCTFRQITSLESSVGVYIGGIIYTMFDECYAVRHAAGTASAKDYTAGFFLNGHVQFGYPGGNASLYMNRCAAADQHAAHVDPVGLLCLGAFVDTFIDHFESARIATGMAFRVEKARAYGNTIDLHIRNPVLDGCSKFGIDIDLDATSSASVEIIDPYIASAGSIGDRGILVHDGAGLTTITGGQIHGPFAGGSLYFARTRGVTVQGTKIHQGLRPVVVDEARGLRIEPQISSYQKSSPHPAVECGYLTRSIVRPVLTGDPAPAFKAGIALDARTSFVEVDPSAIDPSCLADTNAQWKVRFADRDARGDTAFQSAGNRLVGVID